MLKKIEKKYVKSQGSFCPYCDSTDLEGGSMNGDGNYIAMQVYCLNCKSKWQDIYTLTGILEE
jgi:hypothetical protein